MFISAIERATEFTRPVHSIIRLYGGKHIIPGSATLFFVNENGYAVTCKHVAELLAASDGINQRYAAFREDRKKLPLDNKQATQLKGLELKYHYKPDTSIQIRNNFIDCIDNITGITWHMHPTLDLAIIHFQGFSQIHYRNWAVFGKDLSPIKQGKFLCRLGYPFPEFNNFRFNPETDDMEWTSEGTQRSPQFPIEGMVTRFLADNNQMYGIELSTPGLRGQSGGPLFDERGIVYGMQFSTKHLHLGFDLVDKEILVNNQPKKISDYSFLHLGQCIHSEAIKAFLREHGVKYYEE